MASTSGATDDVMNFDTDGHWNPETNQGPAVHAPPSVRGIALTGPLRVEFLDVSPANSYPKHNIIMSVTFPATGGGHQFSRLSVRPDPSTKVESTGNVNQTLTILYLSLTLMFKPRHILPDITINPSFSTSPSCTPTVVVPGPTV